MPAHMKQFRNKDVSLWQSAVDQVVSRSHASDLAQQPDHPVAVRRARADHPLISTGQALAEQVHSAFGELEAPPILPHGTAGFATTLKFCANIAFRLGLAQLRGDESEAKYLAEQLSATFGPCDPRWAEVAAVYLLHKLAATPIPYRRHTEMSDYAIENRLPSKCRVALLADWGTGNDAARLLLKQIAAKKPDVVIHLGDVYYSGTEHEYQNYFYKIWQPTFGIEKVSWGAKPAAPTIPATFTLAGNHDMYSGGQAYYTTIDMLGQPASYFCLRNDDWQFLAMDTGLNNSDPVENPTPPFLESTEVDWIKDKVANANGRKTVLLSHHQLFSHFETIAGGTTNQSLLGQLSAILPDVTAWFWGHEHNLVIYERFQGILARCIGFGGFPVTARELETPLSKEVPIEQVALSPEQNDNLLQHGYVLLDLDGKSAQATYYQFDPEALVETPVHSESFS